MASSSRDDVVIQMDNRPWLSIIDQIDNAFAEIHAAFSGAFAEGKDHVDGTDIVGQKQAIFDELWGTLAANLSRTKHKNLTELNAFYSEAESGLSQEEIFGYPAASISSDKKNMLVQIVHVHHVLAKYRFLLSQFRDSDDLRTFTKTIASIKILSESLDAYTNLINTVRIKHMIETLDAICVDVVDVLHTKGYLQNEIHFNAQSKKSVDDAVSAIHIQLQKLPDTDSINKLIGNYNAAREAADDVAFDQKKSDLIECIAEIQDIKTQTHSLIADNFRFNNTSLDTFMTNDKTLDDKFHELQGYKSCGNFVGVLLEINGNNRKEIFVKRGFRELNDVATAAALIARMQSKSGRRTLGLADQGGWYAAADKLNTLLGDIADNLKALVTPYAQHFEEIAALDTQIRLAAKKMPELISLRTQLAAKFDTTKNIWKQCEAAMTDVQITLTEHINSRIENIKLFILRHWGKMTVGGVGGTGSMITTAALLAGEPWMYVLLIAAGLVAGVGSGAAVGNAVDKCCPAKEKTFTFADPEKQPLLPDQAVEADKIPYVPLNGLFGENDMFDYSPAKEAGDTSDVEAQPDNDLIEELAPQETNTNRSYLPTLSIFGNTGRKLVNAGTTVVNTLTNFWPQGI